MIPDIIRFYCFEGGRSGEGYDLQVYDGDQRRWVNIKWPIRLFLDSDGNEDEDALDDYWDELRKESIELAKRQFDKIPWDILQLTMHEDGTMTTSPVADFDNNKRAAHYPSLLEFELSDIVPKTVLRSELTELDRLSSEVDLVSFADTEKAVFKYANSYKGFFIWQEINLQARLTAHPNILPIDQLVLDEISGSRVVGYTMPFIDGGDLDTNWKSRPFKLKWAKQLMQAVDELNLEYGILHQDIAPRNILIDAATDNLVLFDFGRACQIGTQKTHYFITIINGEEPKRNDIKGVILALHEIVTRDPSYSPSYLHLLDEAPVLDNPTKWVKHPDVVLDPGLTARDYYDELVRWVQKRRSVPQIAHYTQAPRYFDCPNVMQNPPVGRFYGREEAAKYNMPYLEWARPRTAWLDNGRRLLATGKYADEGLARDTASHSKDEGLDRDGNSSGNRGHSEGGKDREKTRSYSSEAEKRDDKAKEADESPGIEKMDDTEKLKESKAPAKRKRGMKADSEALIATPHVQRPRRKSPRLTKQT